MVMLPSDLTLHTSAENLRGAIQAESRRDNE